MDREQIAHRVPHDFELFSDRQTTCLSAAVT
jgi:hypothetical protein